MFLRLDMYARYREVVAEFDSNRTQIFKMEDSTSTRRAGGSEISIAVLVKETHSKKSSTTGAVRKKTSMPCLRIRRFETSVNALPARILSKR